MRKIGDSKNANEATQKADRGPGLISCGTSKNWLPPFGCAQGRLFAGFAKVGTTDPDLMLVRHSQALGIYATPHVCRTGSIATTEQDTPTSSPPAVSSACHSWADHERVTCFSAYWSRRGGATILQWSDTW
jgi:hypothetical protein